MSLPCRIYIPSVLLLEVRICAESTEDGNLLLIFSLFLYLHNYPKACRARPKADPVIIRGLPK